MKRAGFLLLLTFQLGSCSITGDCVDDPLSAETSPDGKLVAIVFQRNCGATTGYSYQVAINGKMENHSDSDVVFVADGDHGKAAAEPLTLAEWESDGRLLIKYDKGARIFRQKRLKSEVAIRYQALGSDNF